MNKVLSVEFIHNDDGTIKTRFAPSEEKYTLYEIYMVYKYLRKVLDDLDFDWSIEGRIETIVQKKEE